MLQSEEVTLVKNLDKLMESAVSLKDCARELRYKIERNGFGSDTELHDAVYSIANLSSELQLLTYTHGVKWHEVDECIQDMHEAVVTLTALKDHPFNFHEILTKIEFLFSCAKPLQDRARPFDEILEQARGKKEEKKKEKKEQGRTGTPVLHIKIPRLIGAWDTVGQ